jgi:hypothetical protein
MAIRRRRGGDSSAAGDPAAQKALAGRRLADCLAAEDGCPKT